MTCLTSDLMGVTGEVPGVSGDMTGEVMCMYWVALDHSSIQEHELYIVHPNIGPCYGIFIQQLKINPIGTPHATDFFVILSVYTGPRQLSGASLRILVLKLQDFRRGELNGNFCQNIFN